MDESIALTNQLEESFSLLRFLLGSGIDLKANPEFNFAQGFIPRVRDAGTTTARPSRGSHRVAIIFGLSGPSALQS